eukprot:1855529-Pleurochrysis_carterae.AAC.1
MEYRMRPPTYSYMFVTCLMFIYRGEHAIGIGSKVTKKYIYNHPNHIAYKVKVDIPAESLRHNSVEWGAWGPSFAI